MRTVRGVGPWIIVSSVACGPDASPSLTTEGSSSTGGQPTGDAMSATMVSADGSTTDEDSTGGQDTETGSEDTGEDPFGTWGPAELVAELTFDSDFVPGGIGYARGIVVTGPWLIGGSDDASGQMWRVDLRSLAVVALDTAGAPGFGSGAFAYATDYVASWFRVEIESLEMAELASYEVIGSNPQGAALLRIQPPTPERPLPVAEIHWAADRAREPMLVHAHEAPTSYVPYGVGADEIVVAIDDEIIAIALDGSETASLGMPIPDATNATVIESHLYFVLDQGIVVMRLSDGVAWSAPIDIVPGSPRLAGSAGRLAWVDAEDPRRLWAATSEGDEIEPAVESESAVRDVELSAQWLYWLDDRGRVFRAATPK